MTESTLDKDFGKIDREEIISTVNGLKERVSGWLSKLLPESKPQGFEKVIVAYKEHFKNWIPELVKNLNIVEKASMVNPEQYSKEFCEERLIAMLEFEEVKEHVEPTPLSEDECEKLIAFLEMDRKNVIQRIFLKAFKSIVLKSTAFFVIALCIAVATAPVYFGIVTLTPSILFTVQGYVYLFILGCTIWEGRKAYVRAFR